MSNNRNYIYIAITAVLLIIFIVFYFAFDNNKIWETDEYDEMVEEYNERVEQEKAEDANREAKVNEILAETPGIACWGDGLTYGTFGEGTSYPYVLEELIKEENYPYEVDNMGVYGEDSRTVLGRTGALPFIVGEDFTIDGNSELIKMEIKSEDGNEVNPCIQDYNPGFNPCVVAGVNCIIYGETRPDDLTRASAYYLSRQDNSTRAVEVPAGTEVMTSGSTEYEDYINILQIGDGGGYSTDTELIEQSERFAEKFGVSGKYIIIGRMSGTADENEIYDSEMENRFGDHYLNVREMLTSEEIEGVEYSQEDKEAMEEGLIPDCLINNGYLNSKGYEAVARLVFERLKELNIIEK